MKVRWVTAKGRRGERDFGWQADFSALSFFIEKDHDPMVERVDLIADSSDMADMDFMKTVRRLRDVTEGETR